MNHVHPIFSPIVESIANQHFLSAVDRVFGILDTPAEPVNDDLEPCVNCGESFDRDKMYSIHINDERYICAACQVEYFKGRYTPGR